MRYSLLVVLFLGLGLPLFAQPAEGITLEDIWGSAKFYPKSVPGFNFQKDGVHYTRLENGVLMQYDLRTGEPSGTLFSAATKKFTLPNWSGDFDDYSFNADESKLLLSTGTESIYRHSSRSNYFIYDVKSAQLQALTEGAKQRYATFSPNAQNVAFEMENDLYVRDLGGEGGVIRLTKDGKNNEIINGASDWVYEEEFTLVRAFEWSPNSRYIAYLRFDERSVPEFTMDYYNDGMYPDKYTFKYPKVGENNAVVTAHIYDLQTGETIDANTGAAPDDYLPRITWTPDNQLCITWMNRHQNHLKLLVCNPTNGNCRTMLEEEDTYYIDLHDNLHFLENGKEFVWTSEKSGKNQAYLYALNGKMLKQLSDDAVEVTAFYGVDEKNEMVYFQGAGNNAMQRELYAAPLHSKKKGKQISPKKAGSYSADYSTTFDYYVEKYSNINAPTYYQICDRDGKTVRILEDNSALQRKMETLALPKAEFFDFTTSTGVNLNGWMLKPENLKKGEKHPTLMFVYGGPGSQQVEDSWRGHNYWWFQMLVQKGYVVACVDNRGTGARGAEFKKMTYQQLGKYETEDQIEAAKYLGTLPYIDAARIGIFGWSYGGFMASHCIFQGADVFKAAIAVAPVTNWKWYDTVYTERYMRTHKENKAGYEDNSPVNYADKLKGNFLLVHGTGDDNVHYQNAVELAERLIANNKQFEMMFYPNKNHGIYGGYTRLHLYTLMTDFLERKLKN